MAETLVVISPTADSELDLAWGTVAPGSSADLKFRIRNDSDEFFARTITVSVDDTTQYLSADGVTFSASLAFAEIAPQAATPILTLRRVIPRAAADGAGSAILTLAVAEWLPAWSA